MCVCILSPIFVWNVSHSKLNWVRYDQKCIIIIIIIIIIIKLQLGYHPVAVVILHVHKHEKK